MTNIKDLPANLKPFAAHGVDLSPDEPKTQADCPFCGKERHLGIETATGLWRCVRCDERGNVYDFVRLLWEYSYRQVTQSDLPGYYSEITTLKKGVQPDIAYAWGLCRSYHTLEWLLPVYNAQGAFSNLYRLVFDSQGKCSWYSTPNLKAHPFGTQLLTPQQTTLWVCEGPWDGMAAHHALLNLRDTPKGPIRTADPSRALYATTGVIAVPGSSAFSEAWLPHFTDREVRLAYDNDWPRKTPSGKLLKAGWEGMLKVAEVVSEAGFNSLKAISRARWGKQGYTKDLPTGYDVRDLLNDKGLQAGYKQLCDMLEPLPIDETAVVNKRQKIDPIECYTFQQLLGAYEQRLYVTDPIRQTLAVMLATVISTPTESDQLWLRVIGPPGSCKSTLAEAISASPEHTFPISLQTGFHSGFRGTGNEKGKETSLIPRMNGKAVVIKDGDTLLTNPALDRILAELRDIYDGVTRAAWRNLKESVFEGLRTTFILCGTKDLRRLNRTNLGERFLDVEIFNDEDRKPMVQRAVANAHREIASAFRKPKPTDTPSDNGHAISDETIKGMTVGYLLHLSRSLPDTDPPTLSHQTQTDIEALGEFVAYMRAKVERDKDGITQRARVELGTRLGKQLLKLALLTAYVTNKTVVDDDVMALVRKVAVDTAHGFVFDAVKLLYRHRVEGLTTKMLELQLSIGEGTARRLLADMLELRIVKRDTEPNKTGQRGRDRHVFRLTPMLQSLYQEALRTDKKPPTRKPLRPVRTASK